MIKLIKKIFKNRKGFTLIELIVVMAIIGIISGIAVPRFANMQKNAKIDADRATARNIVSVTKLYITEKNLADSAVSSVTMTNLVSSGYFNAAPVSQTTGKAMKIAVSGTAIDPVIVVKDADDADIYESNVPTAPYGADAAYQKAGES